MSVSMKKIVTFIFTTLWLSTSWAQQAAQYSLYMLNPYGANPAAAGLEKTLVATGGFRSQWVGLAGSPMSQYVNVSVPLSIISSGVGIALENESIGARRGLSAKASYNFIYKMGESQLSFGASAGILQGALDGSKLRTPEGDYLQGVIDHQDKFLNSVNVNGMVPTFDAGVFFKNNQLDLGISIGNLTEPKLALDKQVVTQLQLKRHYTAYASTHFNLFAGFVAHPSVLIHSDGKQTQVDFSAIFRYDNNFFIGSSFRGYSQSTQDALVILGGFKLNPKLTVAYGYDITLSALKTVNTGSHELVLQYNIGREFGKGKLPPIIYNPRF
jgi:type IX secretion system PorP/SprF family membrane protein